MFAYKHKKYNKLNGEELKKVIKKKLKNIKYQLTLRLGF